MGNRSGIKNTTTENYIDFWKLLPNYYQTLYAHLLKRNWLSRINLPAVGNLDQFSKSITNKNYVLRGLMPASEEKIIQHLIAADQAKYTGMLTKPF
jgi:hypothetical protein